MSLVGTVFLVSVSCRIDLPASEICPECQAGNGSAVVGGVLVALINAMRHRRLKAESPVQTDSPTGLENIGLLGPTTGGRLDKIPGERIVEERVRRGNHRLVVFPCFISPAKTDPIILSSQQKAVEQRRTNSPEVIVEGFRFGILLVVVYADYEMTPGVVKEEKRIEACAPDVRIARLALLVVLTLFLQARKQVNIVTNEAAEVGACPVEIEKGL